MALRRARSTAASYRVFPVIGTALVTVATFALSFLRFGTPLWQTMTARTGRRDAVTAPHAAQGPDAAEHDTAVNAAMPVFDEGDRAARR